MAWRDEQLWQGRRHGSLPPSPDLFVRPQNPPLPLTGSNKPEVGGMWTSTLGDPDGWVGFCDNELWHPAGVPLSRQSYWALTPSSDLDVVTIDSLADLKRTQARWSWHGEYQTVAVRKWGLNFEQMASQGVDGIRLTAEGQWATRLTWPSLYGWDCECTLWLRWVFVDMRAIAPAEALACLAEAPMA